MSFCENITKKRKSRTGYFRQKKEKNCIQMKNIQHIFHDMQKRMGSVKFPLDFFEKKIYNTGGFKGGYLYDYR